MLVFAAFFGPSDQREEERIKIDYHMSVSIDYWILYSFCLI